MKKLLYILLFLCFNILIHAEFHYKDVRNNSFLSPKSFYVKLSNLKKSLTETKNIEKFLGELESSQSNINISSYKNTNNLGDDDERYKPQYFFRGLDLTFEELYNILSIDGLKLDETDDGMEICFTNDFFKAKKHASDNDKPISVVIIFKRSDLIRYNNSSDFSKKIQSTPRDYDNFSFRSDFPLDFVNKMDFVVVNYNRTYSLAKYLKNKNLSGFLSVVSTKTKSNKQNIDIYLKTISGKLSISSFENEPILNYSRETITKIIDILKETNYIDQNHMVIKTKALEEYDIDSPDILDEAKEKLMKLINNKDDFYYIESIFYNCYIDLLEAEANSHIKKQKETNRSS